MKKEKVMPNNVELFWNIPDLIDKDGTKRSFKDYLVHSQTGDIWSAKSGRYLKPCRSTGGYRQVGLMDSNNNEGYVRGQHRFVLAGKVGNWDWSEVEHCSKIRDDNKPSNLIATTRDEQFDKPCTSKMSIKKLGKRSNAAKLSDDVVREIRDGFKAWDGRRRDYVVKMTSELGVSENTIYLIIRNVNYVDVV